MSAIKIYLEKFDSVEQAISEVLKENFGVSSWEMVRSGKVTNGTRDKMLNFHHENYSLPHCIRWGLVGNQELLDEC